MAKLAALPFGERTRKDVPLRRRFTPSQKVSTSITKSELATYLKNKTEGKEVDQELESKFNDYMAEGTASHLSDNTVRGNLANHLKKSLEGENIAEVVGEQSVFVDYVSSKTKAGSLEQSLLEFILEAVEAKKAGKNLDEEPISLASDSLANLANDLIDKEKGLSIRSSKLDRIKQNSDPLLRSLFTVANKLGLSKSIDKTNADLKAGLASNYSSRLAENLSEILKKEETKLKQILPADGSLVVAVKGKTEEKIPKITIDKSKLGDDAGAFIDGEELDFGKFFREAVSLSLKGESRAGDLKEHVSRGLSLIYTHFKIEMEEANGDYTKQKEIRENFNKITDAIQGQGMLPDRVAKIVRDVAADVITSKEFSERVSAGDEANLTNNLVEDLFEDLTSSEYKSLEHLGTIVDANNEIKIIDPNSFSENSFGISKVETNQLTEQADVLDNKYLTGSAVTVQRAVEAYDKTVDNACDKVYAKAVETLTSQQGAINPDKLAEVKQTIADEISDAKLTDATSVKTLLTDNINNAIDQNVNSSDDEAISTALKSTIEKILDIKSSKDKAALWQDKGALTPIGAAVQDLVVSVQTGTKDDPTAGTEAIKDSISKIVDELTVKLGNNEKAMVAKFTGPNGQSRLETIFDGVLASKDDAFDLSKVLDLEKVMQIFDGEKGKDLRTALESLSYNGSKFDDMKDRPDSVEFGEFMTLLQAKNANGSVDQAKRLTALTRLIEEASQGNATKLAGICEHVIDKMRGNDLGDSEATRIASRMKDVVGLQVADLGLTVNNIAGNPATVSDFIDKVVLSSQQRSLGLSELYNGMRRQLDNIRTHFIAHAMDRFASKEKAIQVKTHLDEISSQQEGIDRNDPEALKELKSKLSDEAQVVFNQLEQGITTDPLKKPKYVTEHPGDVIDRIFSFIQNLLFQPAFSSIKAKESQTDS